MTNNKSDIISHIKESLESKISNAFCIITVELEEDFNIIRVFTDGMSFMKGVLNSTNDKIQVIWDSSYPKKEPHFTVDTSTYITRDFKFFCSRFGEPKTIDEFIEYCIKTHLRKYPHHEIGNYGIGQIEVQT